MCWRNANKPGLAFRQTDREMNGQTDWQTDSQQHNKEVVGNENKGAAQVEAARMPSLPALSQPEPQSSCLDNLPQ